MNWLIVFPDYWIRFSPSTINFIKMLKENNQCFTVLYFTVKSMESKSLGEGFVPIYMNEKLYKILSRVKCINLYKTIILFLQIFRVKRRLRFDKFVGFDLIGYTSLRMNFVPSIFYSLELPNYFFANFLRYFLNPTLVVSQNLERKDYLFRSKIPKIILPNSPILFKKDFTTKLYSGKLIYFGNLISNHGIEQCIESLYLCSTNSLTIKTFISFNEEYYNFISHKYHDLIISNRLIFDFDYIDQDNVQEYLSNFDIGFVLLNSNLLGNPNYDTIPSGKLYNYFSAGLPVIGSQFNGLKDIDSFEAGIILKSNDPESINLALERIRDLYRTYSENSYLASIQFDYRKHFNDSRYLLFENT